MVWGILSENSSTVISVVYFMWFYVAISVASFGFYIAYKRHRLHEYDIVFKFALSLAISWFFEALVILWYAVMSFTTVVTSINSMWMAVSVVPAILAVGIVVGGSLHVYSLLKAYKYNRIRWYLWLAGLLFVGLLVLFLSIM